MEPFTNLTAIAAPLVRANVDTDAIIPSREMKTVSKTGLADGLFAGWRYTAIGGREPNPDFVLNHPVYAQAKILLGGSNFGCGSSREHAVWALHEYGFRAVIAPSFSPIFQNNCIRNGILPAVLAQDDVMALAKAVALDPATQLLVVDLPAQTITSPDRTVYAFAIDAEQKEMLVEGLDAIDVTLKQRAAIAAFQDRDRVTRPWVYL
jgi:3-isopropylmalate/(R)-2-methylmalate dehydratase small subunit